MKIVGCDFHPKWQQVAVFDAETGEIGEHKLMNGDGEAERFYRDLAAPALVGLEAWQVARSSVARNSLVQKKRCPVHRVVCDERASAR